MLEIERHRPVPILFARPVNVLALIVGGVVDEDADRPQPLPDLLHRRLERGDVGQIAMEKQRRRPGSADLRHQILGRLDGDIDKADIRLLGGESLDHGGADSRAAAGDEDHPVEQRRVAGIGHRAAFLLRLRRRQSRGRRDGMEPTPSPRGFRFESRPARQNREISK